MKSWPPSSRRHWGALFFIATSLAGCSSDGSDWPALFSAARSYLGSGDSVSREQAAAIPYATLGVRLDGSREQILILSTDVDGEQLWVSPRHLALVIRRGRIVKTVGLSADLSGYIAPAVEPETWDKPHSYEWNGDFADQHSYLASVHCAVGAGVIDPITILGATLQTVRVEEACESAMLNWTFTNTFWVSTTTGLVWRSIQHTAPQGPTIETELLRPPLSYQRP